MLASSSKQVVINIARDFTRYPAGRYTTDGDYSGERFRDEFLEPVLIKHGHAVIEFDGAMGYGSSFLEEAFGGLVRKGYSLKQIKAAFRLDSSDPSIPLEIEDYLIDASS